MLLHFRGGLIEEGLRLAPVPAVKFVEFLCDTACDSLDFLLLLACEIELLREAAYEQVSDGGPLSGKDAGELMANIHAGAHATDQHP